MRDVSEITKAHDTVGVALEALRSVGADGELVHKLEMCMPVLCWILQHPGGDMFDMNLLAIEQLISLDGEGSWNQQPD